MRRVKGADGTITELSGVDAYLGYDSVEDVLKVATLVWDANSLTWVKATQAGGGGGGDATAANQVTGNNSLASIDGKLPALSAGRIPVVLPAGGSGLTDAELRASAVPVSLADLDTRVLGRVKLWDGTDVALVTAAGALVVDGSAVTQPISHANLDVALSTRLKPADTLTGVTTVTSLTQMNGQAISMGTGVRDAGTQRVTIATNDLLDVSDRAAREVGRTRIWDGTDEATVLPVRTQPATTEKGFPALILPSRLPIYGCTTTTITPAITVGVKELLAIWSAAANLKDKYIVELFATILVTTASTAGRSAIRVSTITAAPTGGTELTKADIAGSGASDMTNTMQAKTGGGTIGSTFIRRLVEWPTTPVGRIEVPIFDASNIDNGIILRGGANSGISIDIEREVAHTALVDLITVTARWMEI